MTEYKASNAELTTGTLMPGTNLVKRFFSKAGGAVSTMAWLSDGRIIIGDGRGHVGCLDPEDETYDRWHLHVPKGAERNAERSSVVGLSVQGDTVHSVDIHARMATFPIGDPSDVSESQWHFSQFSPIQLTWQSAITRQCREGLRTMLMIPRLPNAASCYAFSPDNTRLLVGEKGSATVWKRNGDLWSPAAVLAVREDEEVSTLGFVPQKDVVVVAGQSAWEVGLGGWRIDGHLNFYTTSGDFLGRLWEDPEQVDAHCVTSDGRRLALASGDYIEVWDLNF